MALLTVTPVAAEAATATEYSTLARPERVASGSGNDRIRAAAPAEGRRVTVVPGASTDPVVWRLPEIPPRRR